MRDLNGVTAGMIGAFAACGEIAIAILVFALTVVANLVAGIAATIQDDTREDL